MSNQTFPIPQVVVRLARETDENALERLAQLEGRRLAPGRILVADREGNVLAAMGVDGEAIADPFRRTAELVELLERGWAHLRGEGGGRRRRLRETLRGRLAPLPR